MRMYVSEIAGRKIIILNKQTFSTWIPIYFPHGDGIEINIVHMYSTVLNFNKLLY